MHKLKPGQWRVRRPGTVAMWDVMPKTVYSFLCVGGPRIEPPPGVYIPNGCGHIFTDRGATACPKCGNVYVAHNK